MIEYVIEVEVPRGDGTVRWMQLGPSTTDLTGIAPVYSALEARGDRVQLVAYGPKILRSYVDKLPVEPDTEPGKVLPGLKALMERHAPWDKAVAPESLIRTEADGRIVLPTAQEILDKVNAEGITPVDDDAIAAAFPAEPDQELSDKQKTLYEAAGLIPHTNVLGEVTEIPAEAPPAEQAADTLTDLEPLPAEEPAPEITEAAPEPQLQPGDPGFLEQFQRQHAAQIIHRHADGTRTTRSAQALNQ